MNENTVGTWINRTFRETPWTAWLVTINVVTWLLLFFQLTGIPTALMGPLGVDTAWVWLTYPLVTPMEIHWFLLSMYVFYWVCSSLERQWGSQKFGRVFVVVTLLALIGPVTRPSNKLPTLRWRLPVSFCPHSPCLLFGERSTPKPVSCSFL